MVAMGRDQMPWGLSGGRRGRPAKPTTNPLGEYLRRHREERGWTIRQLAKEIGMAESSAGYLSQLETGAKVPSPEVADRRAERLGDERNVCRLWSMTGRRAEPARAARARRELARIFDEPSLMFDERFTSSALTQLETSWRPRRPGEEWRELPPSDLGPQPALPESRGHVEPPEEERPVGFMLPGSRDAASARGSDEGFMRAWHADQLAVRVPLLPEGMPPDEARRRPSGRQESLRLEPGALLATSLERPFAYRLSAGGASRVPDLLREGDIVVMTRDVLPVVRHEVYGVQLGAAVVLGRVIWNGRHLLLLPAPDRSDFEVVPADREVLTQVVVARVATVVRGHA